MSGADLSLRAAASGFVVFLLTVSVIQGQNGWGVTYSSHQICALKGSTVEINCTYRYPSREDGGDTEVEETFWFTKLQGNVPVDLRTDTGYAGRVEQSCSEKSCTLRITDLRESDSAEYKFRFITDQEGGKYTGSPGVTLRVTGFQVKRGHSKSQLNCHSSCRLSHQTSYIWYKNGQKMKSQTSSTYSDYFYSADSYSCAAQEHEDVPAPPVCGYGQSCNRVTYTNRRICAFKGSAVDISCTYISRNIRSKFWFSPERSHQWQSPSRPEDLRDSQFAGRVQVIDTERGRSTLRITDLTESDSAQYRFKFTTQWSEWRSSLPGTTLTVTAPDLKVQVILSPAGPQLICYSSCLTDRSPFIWYQNDEKIPEETSLSYAGYVDPEDSYSCGYEDHRSVPVYAPKLPFVLISPTGVIMRSSQVTLTCSSDANPAAKYTWNKKNGDLDLHPLSKEPQLVFSSIQSSDTGEYYCTAENQLGRRTSESVFVDVKYAPKLPSVSVSPSAEIVEGSSVTVTCSSDANPAANYTWYKASQEVLQGPEGIYSFSSISSEDRGNYSCKSENQYGEINSSSLFIDVQYAPKLPSVSVSPSAEIVEGSSVNLTCSSDANPAANYTWYKKNGDSPKASGQIFTITDFRAEHSGNYYCEAQNRRGRHNSTLQLVVVAGAGKPAAIGIIIAILLLLVPIAAFIWMRRNTSFTQQASVGKRPDNGGQVNLSEVYGNVSGDAQSHPAEQDGELHYASIHLSVSQEEALYCNIRPARLHGQTEEEEEEEEDGVDYSVVKTDNTGRAPGTRLQEDGKVLFV